MEPNEFAQQVRDRRRQEKLSQQALAEKIGISRNYLSEIERGKANNLSWQVRKRLIDTLGLTPDPAGTIASADIPDSLADFAANANLPPEDVLMLAKLKYRGKQPTTAEKWELLYNVIKMTAST